MAVGIEFREVSKHYANSVAVDALSFEIAPSEFCVLLGSSGCGKTTSLKMINRLIEPTHGEIRLNGKNVFECEPISLRRSMGYVIQNVGLFPHLSVSENIGLGPRLAGWRPPNIRKRVDELLALVHLEPGQYRDRMPSQLSGGQKQRIGFARALAVRPGVLLMDEPFGAVDPVTRAGLQRELSQLQKEFRFTVVMVTHDISEALLLADKIVVMDHGKAIQVGTPGMILKKPANTLVQTLIETPLLHHDHFHKLLSSNGAS